MSDRTALAMANLMLVILLLFSAPTFAQSVQRDYERRIDRLYGKGDAVNRTTFDPADTANHTCKRMPSQGLDLVEMWVCVVDRGNVISKTGDLIAVAMSRNDKPWSVDVRCESVFKPATEFVAKKFRTFGTLRVTPAKRHDFIIITPQLSRDSRAAWRDFFTNTCSWSATEIEAAVAPRCPPLEVWTNGRCESILGVRVVPR